MLIKYLNELQRAIDQAQTLHTASSYGQVAAYADRLLDYLNTQDEAIRQTGNRLMQQMLPAEFETWMETWFAAEKQSTSSLTDSPHYSLLAGS